MLAPRLLRALLMVAACCALSCAREHHGRRRAHQTDAGALPPDASDAVEDASADADAANGELDASDAAAELDASPGMADASTDAALRVDAAPDATPSTMSDAAPEPYLAFTLDLRYPQVSELFAVRADQSTEIERLSPDPRRSQLVVQWLRYVHGGQVLLAAVSREGGEPLLYALPRAAPPQQLSAQADTVVVAQNGTAIAVAADNEAPLVYRILPTGAERVVPDQALPVRQNNEASSMLMAADGAHLLYQPSVGTLAVVTLDGARAGHVEYVEKSPGERERAPYAGVWASDGKHFAYRSWGAQLYLASPESLQDAVKLGPNDLEQCAQLQAVDHVSGQYAYIWCRRPKTDPDANASVFVFNLEGQQLSRVDDVPSYGAYCDGRALLSYATDRAVLLGPKDGQLARLDFTLAGPALRMTKPVFSSDCAQAAYAVDGTLVQLDLAQSLATGTVVQRRATLPATRAPALSFSPRGRYLSVRSSAPLLFDLSQGLLPIPAVSGSTFFGPNDAALYRTLYDEQKGTTALQRHELPDTSRSQTLVGDLGGAFAFDDEARFLAFSARSQDTAPAGLAGGLYELDLSQGATATPVQRLDRPMAPAGRVASVRFAKEKTVVFDADLEESGVFPLYARTLEPGASTVRQDLGSARIDSPRWLLSRDGAAFAAMFSAQGEQRAWVAPVQLRARDPRPAAVVLDLPRFSELIGFGPDARFLVYGTFDMTPTNLNVHVRVDTGFARVDLRTSETTALAIEPDTRHLFTPFMAPRTGSVFFSVLDTTTEEATLEVLDANASATQHIASNVFQYHVAPSEEWLAVELMTDQDRSFGVARRADGWRLTMVDKLGSARTVRGIIEHEGTEYVVFDDGSSWPAGFQLDWSTVTATFTPDRRSAVQLIGEADATQIMRASPPYATPARAGSLPGSSSDWSINALSANARYLVATRYQAGPSGPLTTSYLVDLEAPDMPFRLPAGYRYSFDRSERYLAFEDRERGSLPTILTLRDHALAPIGVPPGHKPMLMTLDWVE